MQIKDRLSAASAVDLAGKPLTPEKEKQLKKACADFEALFVYELFKTMRRTVPRGGLLPKTTGYDSWDMVMDQHVAEELSKRNGGLGLQKIIFEQVIKTMKSQGSTK